MKKLQKSALVATLLISIPTCLVYSSPKTVVKQTPFKGQSGGVITTVGFDPIKLIAYTHVEGKGHATRLGNFTVTGVSAVYVATGVVLGNWQLTAANGDILFVTMEGSGIDPTHGSGLFTIVGGTGRFEGATGSYNQIITFAVPGGSADVIPYTDVLEGSISTGLQ
jgi:hypothetical protein